MANQNLVGREGAGMMGHHYPNQSFGNSQNVTSNQLQQIGNQYGDQNEFEGSYKLYILGEFNMQRIG